MRKRYAKLTIIGRATPEALETDSSEATGSQATETETTETGTTETTTETATSESDFTDYDMRNEDEATRLVKGRPRVSNFVFTQFNIDVLPTDIYQGLFSYMCWQLEAGGENGTPHIQGYCQLKKREYLARIWKLNPLEKGVKGRGAYVVMARGSDADNVKYCSKEETRLDGPYEIGVRRTELRFQDRKLNKEGRAEASAREANIKLMEVYDGTFEAHADEENVLFAIKRATHIRTARELRLENISPDYFPNTRVFIHWGVSRGGKGTHAISGIYDAENKFVGFHNNLIPDKDFYYELSTFSKEGIPWFQRYNGQKRLVINEFEKVPFSFAILLSITDKVSGHFQKKGGDIIRNWDEVHITSNTNPKYWYEGTDLQPLINRVSRVFYYPNVHSSQTSSVKKTFEEMTEIVKNRE